MAGSAPFEWLHPPHLPISNDAGDEAPHGSKRRVGETYVFISLETTVPARRLTRDIPRLQIIQLMSPHLARRNITLAPAARPDSTHLMTPCST
jgi:hypothetical protein